MKSGLCSCRVSDENDVIFVAEHSGHFRASFPEEGGAAKLYKNFHSIFMAIAMHGKPCRDDLPLKYQNKYSSDCRKVLGGMKQWLS